MIQKVNLQQELAGITEHWVPQVMANLNGQQVRIAKLQGEFVWHHHAHEDELFYVIQGTLIIRLRDQPDITLNAGEFVVIPRGIEHQPVAEAEVHLLLFEPAETLNTGNIQNELTRPELNDIPSRQQNY